MMPMIHEKKRCTRYFVAIPFAVACAASSTEERPAAQASNANIEDSVRPGANANFLAPNVDVAEWTGRFEGEAREIAAKRDAIAEALGLERGMRVVDIGAGTGLFLGPMARRVGPDGRVVAVEISPAFLAHLRERKARENLAEVEVVEGLERSLTQPEKSIDIAFVCDTYHHFEFPRSMLASIHSALRPGGAMFIVDFERVPGKSRTWVIDHVRAGKNEVRSEIEAAGFVFDREIAIEGLVENYVLRFTRP